MIIIEELEEIIIYLVTVSTNDLLLEVIKWFGELTGIFCLIYFMLWGIFQCYRMFKNISNS